MHGIIHMLFVSSNSNLELFFFQLPYQLNDLAQLDKGFTHTVNQVILIEVLQWGVKNDNSRASYCVDAEYILLIYMGFQSKVIIWSIA